MTVNHGVAGSNPARRAIKYGPFDKRLSHPPFTGKSRVRIPDGLP
jgi:hypothetical protein